MTRERIRQIAKRDTEFIRSELERLAPGLAVARDRLGERFGIAVLVGGEEDQAWREQTRTPDHPQLENELHSMLLWLAGYKQHEGYWTLDPDHCAKTADAVTSVLGSSWLLSERAFRVTSYWHNPVGETSEEGGFFDWMEEPNRRPRASSL